MNTKRLKLSTRFQWPPGTRIRAARGLGTVQAHASYWSSFGRHDSYIVLWDGWLTPDEIDTGPLETLATKV